jgi:hypothetical protein
MTQEPWQKMEPALPLHLGLIDELQVALVNQRRRIQGVVVPLVLQLVAGNLPQFIVDLRPEPFGGRLVPILELLEQLCDIRVLWHKRSVGLEHSGGRYAAVRPWGRAELGTLAQNSFSCRKREDIQKNIFRRWNTTGGFVRSNRLSVF